jgi:hypothetical protein
MTHADISTTIAERARAGEVLTDTELHELDRADVLSLGMLADEVRRARVGDEVGYTRVLEVDLAAPDLAPDAGDALARAGEVRLVGLGGSLDAASDAVRRIRAAIGPATRLSGFSLATLRDAGWGTLAATLAALKGAGLQAIAEAPIDLVEPADAAIVFDVGLELGALSVHEPCGEGRVALVRRLREFTPGQRAVKAVAPLARVQTVSAPTTGYHDVRLVALTRLALPDVAVVQVDWPQFGPKLAQVALTFGANHLDRVSCSDDPALGWRRASVEEVRRNIVAAGFTPVESGVGP